MNIDAKNWEQYIGSRKTWRRDTALFPMLDGELPERDLLLIDRFRWLCSTFDVDTDKLFERWKEAGDSLTEERIENASMLLQEFHNYSINLALVMAQSETERHNLDYYRQLRDALKLRPVRRKLPVLVIGPTFGGEVEAVSNAGGSPVLIADTSPWLRITEERLFHDRVEFDTLSPSSFSKKPVHSRYVVVSSWVPDPVIAVTTAYNALGECGFVCFPATNPSLTDVAERVRLKRLDSLQPEVAAYFKHPGLEETLGHVHFEA